jgi:glutamate--cysteine ligase
MTAPLALLNTLCQNRPEELALWFSEAYHLRSVPIYSSVDVRHAGFKIAPVDTNLFPAGFNNLTEQGKDRAVAALKRYISQLPLTVKTMVIMSENHTRNRPYFDNVAMLAEIVRAAGIEVRIGRFDLGSHETMNMETTSELVLQGEAVHLSGTQLITSSGFLPDIILVNNDLSTGCPQILCDAQQPVFPPPNMGWYRRRKSVHFTAYNQVANEFSRHFELDSWMISTVIHHCGKINFKEKQGLECVALGVDKVLHAIRQKYALYGIDRTPYVYVKADSGTYGMGIMTVHSGEEIYDINKKARNKMNVIKEGVTNTEVIIQEGVPTMDIQGSDASEPVVYLMGGEVVGKVWRINEGRGEEESLNAMGMRFTAFDEASFSAESGIGLIAKLATLASVYEHYDRQK